MKQQEVEGLRYETEETGGNMEGRGMGGNEEKKRREEELKGY